ncbi:MAG: hypothetical protein H9535_19700 [Ignavibacteria bacterium]|nr:hypothetical protein [Ignavibacteria bacterium]
MKQATIDIRAAAELELRRRQRIREEQQAPDWITLVGLMDFIPYISPAWQSPLHLAPIVQALERVLTESVKLVIEVPPRHFKTETVLHAIAWILRQQPHRTVGYVSYAIKQAHSKALKAQRYSLQAGLKPDKQMHNLSEWRVSEGGGILATGIGGPLTGQGLDVGIIDDPTKNREDAESRQKRDKQWGWFEDVFETRYAPNASAIVVLTRWHEDDLAGRIMKERPEFEFIRLPALADCKDASGVNHSPDPLGRMEGEALLPERYSREYLEQIRAKKPYTFASLYQGLPRPRQAKVFGDATFYEKLPEKVSYSVGGDLAYTESTRAHWSSVVVYAVDGDMYYVVHVERWQSDITATTERLKRIQARYPVRIHLEANGPQKAVCDMLEERKIRIKRLQPSADKYVRAMPFAEAWNAGRVLLPNEAPWLSAYLDEINDFTGVGDIEDDQVDASANGFQRIKRPGIYS